MDYRKSESVHHSSENCGKDCGIGSRPTSCNEQRHSLLIQTVGVMKSFFIARSAARAVDDLAAR